MLQFDAVCCGVLQYVDGMVVTGETNVYGRLHDGLLPGRSVCSTFALARCRPLPFCLPGVLPCAAFRCRMVQCVAVCCRAFALAP